MEIEWKIAFDTTVQGLACKFFVFDEWSTMTGRKLRWHGFVSLQNLVFFFFGQCQVHRLVVSFSLVSALHEGIYVPCPSRNGDGLAMIKEWDLILP
jgi:hypothetical protein